MAHFRNCKALQTGESADADDVLSADCWTEADVATVVGSVAGERVIGGRVSRRREGECATEGV